MLGEAISGVFNYAGQNNANNTNIMLQNKANQFNAKEAEKNRQWQAEMSNTAKTREVADLKNAGLNRLLAATGGASTPSGGAATGGAAHVENALSGAVSSAMEAGKLSLQKRMQGAQLGNLEEQNKLLQDQQKKTRMETFVMSKGVPEADLKNSIYSNLLKPIVDKINGINKTSANSPKALPQNEVDDLIKKAEQKRLEKVNQEKATKKQIQQNRNLYDRSLILP